jgi:DNA-binding LacI/PurR family transcriptional regulator
MPRVSRTAARGPVKMREIAHIAQVSTATISRVINNSSLVDPETAKRVREIITKHNYIPNNTGIALKSGRSGIFGLIVPDITNPFFADFVKHFERTVVDNNQEMMLSITDHLPEEMRRSTRRMVMRNVEGIVILESEIETSSYEAIFHNRVPLVTLNRLLTEPCVSDVAIDTLSGMTTAVAHLKALGHRRIGFLGGRPGQRISMDRDMTFRAAMKKMKVAVIPEAIAAANFTIEGGRDAMDRLLLMKDRVTAVLCANDLSAIGAMNAVHDAGLTPGRDVSVIGLDDIDLCTMVRPALTTLRSSRPALVQAFLRALNQLSRNPRSNGEQVTVQLEFVERDSTGPCPKTT